jgi:hypothetical protein
VLSDVYANVLEVLVPIGTDEDEDVPSEVHEVIPLIYISVSLT